MEEIAFGVIAAGQVNQKWSSWCTLDEVISGDGDRGIDIAVLSVGSRLRRCRLELHDCLSVRFPLELRILRAEMVKSLLYRCIKWIQNDSLGQNPTASCSPMHRKMKRDDHTLC